MPMIGDLCRLTRPGEAFADDPGGELVRCAWHVETLPRGQWITAAMGDSLSIAVRLARTGDWPLVAARRVTYGGNVVWERKNA